MRPPASFRTAAWAARVHVPEGAHSLRPSRGGSGYACGSSKRAALGRCETGTPAVGHVGLGRSQALPIGRDLEPLRVDGHEILIDADRTGFEQQLLDHHLGHRVLALAEMVVPDAALGIRDVQRRPEVVRERCPHPVVAVDGDRVLDAEAARPRNDVVDVALETELGRVNADHRETGVRVFRGPGPPVWERAQPVDAGIGPEVDEDDSAAEGLGRERLRVEP